MAIDWRSLHHINISSALKTVLEKHFDVFSNDLGKVKGTKAKICIDPKAIPKFCKARVVPYALCKKVDLELERMEKEGIIESVEFSD